MNFYKHNIFNIYMLLTNNDEFVQVAVSLIPNLSYMGMRLGEFIQLF